MIVKLNDGNDTYEVFSEFKPAHLNLLKGDPAMARDYKVILPARNVLVGYDCLLFIGTEKSPTDVVIRVLTRDF